MLRVAAPPPPVWDALLPPEVPRLPDELARIDAYLDDERFITPWRALFSARLGRLAGARAWVGVGVFAYNLQRMTLVTR